ncbi:MAG: hypothetical protein HOV80_31535 [Polyangiaceae bacterium]|nr:hypothetical protein [Polyangiaceae bacterium]
MRRARVAIVLASAAVVVAGLTLFGRFWTSGGKLPGPHPSSVTDPVIENAACEACHADVAAEWRSSEHASAFSDPIFGAAFAVEPTAFCAGCHAPEQIPQGEPGAKAALGVACVTCHLAGDAVLAAPTPGLSFAPHRVEESAAFAGSGACAGCHEFSFGDDARREVPLAMQATVSEHAASGSFERSCADCHMPRAAAGHRSHAFASTRDPVAHQKSVRVSAERAGPTTLRVELELDGVGHRYPTGDLFRRVAVFAEVVGDDYQSASSATRYLARHFATGRDLEGRPIRVEASDDRAEPGAPSIIDLELGDAALGRPIAWTVAYERVLHVSDHLEPAADVSSRIVLAQGQASP